MYIWDDIRSEKVFWKRISQKLVNFQMLRTSYNNNLNLYILWCSSHFPLHVLVFSMCINLVTRVLLSLISIVKRGSFTWWNWLATYYWYRGHKKVCLIFCILHFFVGVWKRISEQPSIFVTSIYLSLANTIFSFSFETWMVTQHEKVIRKFSYFILIST